MRLVHLLGTVALLTVPVFAQWNAGVAKVSITPEGPLFMAGYGNRKAPSEGVAQELYAKALVLEDATGGRAVLLTTDMLGFPASLSASIAARLQKAHGIARERILFNSSHTHCGPVVRGQEAAPTYNMGPKDFAAMDAYTHQLEEKLVAVVGSALGRMAPARLSFGKTVAGFGVHRRMPGAKLWGPNYAGPADHDVPVLRVESSSGALVALVFGYACHNSTIGIMKFHGDYAGSAQKWLEERHPGAVALFVMGFGGDVKPYPNGTVELAEAYGGMLGAAVEERCRRPMTSLDGRLKTTFGTVQLQFGTPPTRAQLEAAAREEAGSNRRWGQAMLKKLDGDGHLPTEYPYPVQAWQLGELTMVALGGEVTSEYALRLNRELGGDRLWLAGYSNDEFAYIPSRRILDEGGYEAGLRSMEFYLQPGAWAPSVEEMVVEAVHAAVKRVR
jgi:hypothetical protein